MFMLIRLDNPDVHYSNHYTFLRPWCSVRKIPPPSFVNARRYGDRRFYFYLYQENFTENLEISQKAPSGLALNRDVFSWIQPFETLLATRSCVHGTISRCPSLSQLKTRLIHRYRRNTHTYIHTHLSIYIYI